MRRKEVQPVGGELYERCLALQRGMGLDRVIQYCECHGLDAPAVLGWFRPVVLLPVRALTGLSEQQIEAVIAHELAHIRRLDCFVNLFQIAAETLLFYHPAVWWVSQGIRAERENCCDDEAISLCGDAVNYARALTLMEEWRTAPRLMMAANRSPLAQRVVRVLGWLAIAVAGAYAIGVLAVFRGETVNAVWFVVAAAAVYALAYRFYSRFIAQRILEGLRLELTDLEVEKLNRRATDNAEAWEAYLRGRDNFGRFIFRTIDADDCDGTALEVSIAPF